MSISGWPGMRSPTGSPIQSIGASSRSPSPMTMVPCISTSSIVARIASVAGSVGLVRVAAAHEAGGGDRGRLGDADHLEREQRLHGMRSRQCVGSGAGR